MSRRLRRAAFGIVLALAVVLFFGGCRRSPESAQAARPTPAPASGKTNLLLITLDTLRPDALGFVCASGGRCESATPNATPVLDGMAREGFAFPGAVSPVPLTFPAHSALMTGMLPRALGLRDNGQLLPPQPPTLAERLAARGYATAAFVSGYPLHSTFGLNRGFSHYDDAFDSGKGDEPERKAGATVAAAKAWLAHAKAPWFLWVHLYDPHYPYEPPPEFRRPGPRGAYDGEVAYADSAIGDLLRAAAAADTAQAAPASGSATLTVFAGDHGESLGEHGEGTHGFFVYDSTALVPLVFRFPGRVPVGSSATGARLIDVAPTILDLLGVAATAGERADGRSLAPLWRGGGAAAAPAYVETYQPWLSYGWSPLRAMRAEGWKLIDAPRPELYDLRADPGERHDRFADSPEEARRLKLLLRQVQDAAAPPPRPAADAEALARLRSLGYLGGSTPGAEPPAEGLRDPKDGAAVRELLTRGDELLRRGEAREAAIRFESALEQDPDNRFALHRSGLALLQLGQLPRALSRLEKAVRLGPDQPEARWALADALARSGRLDDAIRQWEEIVRLQPRRAEAWANLGSALGRSGKEKEAAAALAHAVGLSPNNPNPDLLARLAFAEFGAGDVAGAARHLREESERRAPGEFRHAGALGILLAQLGRAEEARPYLRQSRPEEPEYAEARLKLASLEADAGRESEARRALADALRASPSLRARVLADARLSKLLP